MLHDLSAMYVSIIVLHRIFMQFMFSALALYFAVGNKYVCVTPLHSNK